MPENVLLATEKVNRDTGVPSAAMNLNLPHFSCALYALTEAAGTYKIAEFVNVA